MIDINELFKNLNKDIPWVKTNTIFLTVHGSVAYGLNTPESDIDLRGVTCPTKEYFLGFNKKFEQWITKAPTDCTIFEIRKFFSLSSKGNPNCLEILFTDPEDHILVNDLGQKLLDNRDVFISKLLKESYIGYAKGQAHRIRSHRKYILNGYDHCPTREECGLKPAPAIKKEQYDAIKSLINSKLEQWRPDFEPFSNSQKIYLQNKVSDILTEMKITLDDKWEAASRSIGLDENLIQIMKDEKQYENKVQDYANYIKWKEERNPKRAYLEEKYLYDTKHGSHLVRLLRMGKEILTTGKLQVKRTDDREELLAIKQGAWTFEQLIDYADKIEDEVKEAYKNSKLPNQPNIKLLDKLCIEIIEKSIERDQK